MNERVSYDYERCCGVVVVMMKIFVERKKMTTTGSSKSSLPPQVEDMRTRVRVGKYAPTQTTTFAYHSSFANLNYDNSFSLEDFQNNLQINVLRRDENDLIFEMIGVDAPIANAFRRIMLSEVPSMAIEKIVYITNTSIIQDEVLAHRIGLVPIRADPDFFYFARDINQNEDISAFAPPQEPKHNTHHRSNDDDDEDIQPPTPTMATYAPSLANKSTPFWQPPEELLDNEYILFELNVTCEKTLVPNPHNNNKLEYKHAKVYSGDLKWIPIGNQAEYFNGENAIRPVFDDILLAKLNPGQSIHVQCYCVKGIGRSHAKWQPVATASYRLLPEITFKGEPITDIEQAKELVQKCPMNVFDIEENPQTEFDSKVRVARPMNCTMCRECIREDDWDKRVQLSKVKDHFIFSIESVGSIPGGPAEIFRRALKIFWQKCEAHLLNIRKNPIGTRQQTSSSSTTSMQDEDNDVEMTSEQQQSKKKKDKKKKKVLQ